MFLFKRLLPCYLKDSVGSEIYINKDSLLPQQTVCEYPFVWNLKLAQFRQQTRCSF